MGNVNEHPPLEYDTSRFTRRECLTGVQDQRKLVEPVLPNNDTSGHGSTFVDATENSTLAANPYQQDLGISECSSEYYSKVRASEWPDAISPIEDFSESLLISNQIFARINTSTPQTIVQEIVDGTNVQPTNIEINVKTSVSVHRDACPANAISHEAFNIVTCADATNITTRHPELAPTIPTMPLSACATPFQMAQGLPSRAATPILAADVPDWAHTPEPDPVESSTFRGRGDGRWSSSATHIDWRRDSRRRGRGSNHRGHEYRTSKFALHLSPKQPYSIENPCNAWDSIPAPANSLWAVDPHSHAVIEANSTKVDGTERIYTGPDEDVDKWLLPSEQRSSSNSRRGEASRISSALSNAINSDLNWSGDGPEYYRPRDADRWFVPNVIRPSQVRPRNKTSNQAPNPIDSLPIYLGPDEDVTKWLGPVNWNSIEIQQNPVNPSNPPGRTRHETDVYLSGQKMQQLQVEEIVRNHSAVSNSVADCWQNVHDPWTGHDPLQFDHFPSSYTEAAPCSNTRLEGKSKGNSAYRSRDKYKEPTRRGIHGQGRSSSGNPNITVGDGIRDLPPHLSSVRTHPSRNKPQGPLQVGANAFTPQQNVPASPRNVGNPWTNLNDPWKHEKAMHLTGEHGWGARDVSPIGSTENLWEARPDPWSTEQMERSSELISNASQTQSSVPYTWGSLRKSAVTRNLRLEEVSSTSGNTESVHGHTQQVSCKPPPTSTIATNDSEELHIDSQINAAVKHEPPSSIRGESGGRQKRRVHQVNELIKVTERYLSLSRSKSENSNDNKGRATSASTIPVKNPHENMLCVVSPTPVSSPNTYKHTVSLSSEIRDKSCTDSPKIPAVMDAPNKYGLINSGTPPPRRSYTREQSRLGERINTPPPSDYKYQGSGRYDPRVESGALPREELGKENQLQRL
ncbi:hypothetical protein VKT23_001792 [Stygiomarasmius scandens]|uniref:Uncharacterized protein n=1 Tax=Marasmiellus scandens TaxID=2682957 RepID=A0ABR1K2K4_9AGAR